MSVGGYGEPYREGLLAGISHGACLIAEYAMRNADSYGGSLWSPTEEEWFEAVKFLTRTGQFSSDNRQEDRRVCAPRARRRTRRHRDGHTPLHDELRFRARPLREREHEQRPIPGTAKRRATPAGLARGGRSSVGA